MRSVCFFIFAILLIPCFIQAQTPSHLLEGYRTANTDSARSRYLLELSYYYLNKPGEENTDLDSALLLASQSRELSRRLHLTTQENNAAMWIGRIYVEGKKFKAAVASMKTLNVIGQDFVLGSLFDYELRPSPGEQQYADTALIYAKKCVSSKELMHHAASIRGAYLDLSYCYQLTGDTTKFQQIFQQLFDICLDSAYWDETERVYRIMIRHPDLRDRNTPIAGSPRWDDLMIASHKKIRDKATKLSAGRHVVNAMDDLAYNYYIEKNGTRRRLCI